MLKELNTMNKTDWQSITDSIISSEQGRKPTLLLHACCAPCASASLEYLTEFFSVDVFFCNPNISSAVEFEKRLVELKRFVGEAPFTKGVNVIFEDYEHNEFLNISKGLETLPEGGGRCAECFRLRLKKSAEIAESRGYNYFATTLTISPLKNSEVINGIGYEVSENKKVKYLPTDLKKRGRYQRSIVLSKEYGLYRQNFCGCEFSFNKV